MPQYREINNNDQSTAAGRIAKGAGFGLADILGSIIQFPETISNAALQPILNKGFETITGQPVPSEEINQFLRQNNYDQNKLQRLPELLGISRESYAPQSLTEKGLQNILSKAPLAATGGAPGLLSLLASEGAARGAESLNFSEPVQTAAQLTADLASGPLIKSAKNKFSGYKRELYNKASEIGDKFTVPASPLVESSEKAQKFLNTEVDEKISKPIKDALETVSKNIFGDNKINLTDTWNLRKSLDKTLRGNKSLTKTSKHFLEDFRDNANKIINDSLEIAPEFLKHLKPADQVHMVENVRSVISDVIQDLPGELIKLLPGGAAAKLITKPLNYIFDKTLRDLERGVLITGKSVFYPHAFKLIAQVGKEAINENPGQLLKYAKKLNNLAKVEESKEPKVTYREIL